MSVLPDVPLLATREPEPFGRSWDRYLCAGWHVVPTRPSGPKDSPIPESGMTGIHGVDADVYVLWMVSPIWADANVALRMPEGVVGIDVDAYGDKKGAVTLAAWEAEFGPLPPSPVSTARSDGVSGIRFFRVPEGTRRLAGDLGADSGIGVLQRHHRFAQVWPTWKAKTESTYRWLWPDGRPVDEVPVVAELPMLPQAWVDRLVKTDSDRPVPTDVPELYDGTAAGGTGAAWVAAQPQDELCPPVQAVVERAVTDLEDGLESRHQVALSAAWHLVNLAREGHHGVGPALETLEGTFLASKPDGAAEWGRMMDGAVAKAPGDPEGSCLCGLMSGSGLAATGGEFWDARPVLAHLRDFARSRMASPWAVLGVVLCRAVAGVPPWVTLPPLVGGHGSLNLFTALVGPSGAGKGAAESAARDALDLGAIEEATPGSGEGMAHAYAHRESGKLIWDQDSVLFSIPEVDVLTALGSRQGSTILPLLRQGWMGERLGSVTADASRKIPLLPHSYRMGLVLGVQPDRAEALLSDAGGGTPQRFLWLPVLDPDAPEQTPPEPPDFPLAPMVWKRPKATVKVAMKVPEEAVSLIQANRRAQVRGETEALDGHSLLARLKVAAALAVLDRRKAVDSEDWKLAGLVMAVSDHTRAGVVGHLAARSRESNLARGQAEGARAAVAQDAAAEHAEKRVAAVLMKKLRKAGPTARSEARRRFLASRDRQHFDGAVERLEAAGQITVEQTEHGERLMPAEDR